MHTHLQRTMVQRKRKSILRAKARARDGRRYVLSVDWPVDRANKPRCNLIANAPAENTCASDEFRSLPLLLSHLEPTACPPWNWIHVLRSRCQRSLVNIKAGGLKHPSSSKNFKDILNISACVSPFYDELLYLTHPFILSIFSVILIR